MIGDCREIGGIKIGRGNPSTRRKPAPAPTLSTTNSTWLDPSLNPDHRGGKRATIFLLLLVGWVFWYCGHYWPIVPAPDDRWWWLWRNWWNEYWEGKPKYSVITCPIATLSTRNHTWLHPGLNPGRGGGKPETNRLSYGAAVISLTFPIVWIQVVHRLTTNRRE
jgi:hypothetical protein